MMKLKLVLPLSLLTLFVLTSCQKYEDGPLIAFQTKESRIANTWVIEQATDEDGNDITGNYETSEWELRENGGVTVSITLGGVAFNFEGEWDLIDDKETLQIQLEGNVIGVPFSEISQYPILRLTKDELWVLDENDNELRWQSK
jgi:hypothetical protein